MRVRGTLGDCVLCILVLVFGRGPGVSFEPPDPGSDPGLKVCLILVLAAIPTHVSCGFVHPRIYEL